MTSELADDTVVKSGSDVVSCTFGGGEVLLDLKKNVYFSLNAVGAFVWTDLSARPRSIESIRKSIVAAFDVAETTCSKDLLALLGDMREAGLIEIAGAQASATAS